jgi:hypothetical protein
MTVQRWTMAAPLAGVEFALFERRTPRSVAQVHLARAAAGLVCPRAVRADDTGRTLSRRCSKFIAPARCLCSLKAADGPIVVEPDKAAAYHADGLLGLSFLSRFNVSIDGRSVRVATSKPC